MPVNFLPAPGAGPVIPASSVGPGVPQQGAASLSSPLGGGEALKALQPLIQAMLKAKQRQPPPVPTPQQATGLQPSSQVGNLPPGAMGPL